MIATVHDAIVYIDALCICTIAVVVFLWVKR